MTNPKMIHVVLCGGTGSRLWPLSRELSPKQFIPLIGEKTLFQTTVIGNQNFCNQVIVVCSIDHYYLAERQMKDLKILASHYLLEPFPKNTAAACGLALSAVDPETILLITPADHFIDYNEGYEKAVAQAKKNAEMDFISIFGIKPRYPETGYGYVEAENGSVLKFHEKPDLSLAEKYVESGDFFWNSGMICAKAKVLQKHFKNYANNILEASLKAYALAEKLSVDQTEVVRVRLEDMSRIPADSIDYALLEKMVDLKVVTGTFKWNDLGSFDSLYFQLPKDNDGNAITGQCHSINSKNTLILGSDRVVTTIDVEDLMVVDTKDALLISKRGSSQKVKEIVQKIKVSGTYHHKNHLEEQRPWGHFSVLSIDTHFKVKKITVHPGKKLSLQKHIHRNEHWIIVSGTALVTVGEKAQLFHPNQSVYISAGELHRIENPGKIDVEFIEVQFGDYTEEDDIIRIEDTFIRSNTTNS